MASSLYDDLDIVDPSFIQNPYPVYRALQKEDPVHWHDGSQSQGFWMVTAYQTVKDALRDPRLSSGGGRGSTTLNALPPEKREPYTQFLNFYNKWVLLIDPPAHTRIRKLANKGFTPKQINALNPYMRGLVDGLLNDIATRGRVHFMEEFAYVLPAMVITDMLGAPLKDREQLVEWSNDIAVLIGLGEITMKALRRINQSYHEITDYFENHIEHLRMNPRDNVLHALMDAAEDGDRLTTEELLAQAVVLLIGGHETTRNLIGSGMYLLHEHPDQLAIVREHPELMESAIEEFLRLESPVQFVGRTAKTDMNLGGRRIKAGDVVMLILAAANRDPSVFRDPDRMNIQRKPNKHLSFGLGQHYCLGAPLARVQAMLALNGILQRFKEFTIHTPKPVWAPSPVFRGIEKLDISFT